MTSEPLLLKNIIQILLKSICTKSHNKWWTSTLTERAATINKLLKCKSRSGIPASQPLPPFFAPENCNYRFPAIWCPTLVSAHWHPVPNRLRFFFFPPLHTLICLNLVCSVPADVSLHGTLRRRVLRYTREGEGWGSKRRPSLTEMNGRKSQEMMRRDLFWVMCSERCTQGCYLYTCQRNGVCSGSFILTLWMSPQSEDFPSTVDFF